MLHISSFKEPQHPHSATGNFHYLISIMEWQNGILMMTINNVAIQAYKNVLILPDLQDTVFILTNK